MDDNFVAGFNKNRTVISPAQTEPSGRISPIPVILGPTASGKTRLAARLASEIGGEVISADSRQVYRGMDIGTGKDLDSYTIEGKPVPVHLIDIADPGYEYNVYEFQRDFIKAWRSITEKGKVPVLCGGSGMYLEAVIKGYRLPDLPEDPGFLAELESRPVSELLPLYYALCKPHNTTDTVEKERIIKAIRIAVQSSRHTEHDLPFPVLPFTIFGIKTDRERLRRRITERLHDRIGQGMIREVQNLLDSGITPERLKRYGLEYKFVVLHLTGDLSLDEMTLHLNTAIHQFAKRQMTWFRKMERQGIMIRWLEETLAEDEKIGIIRSKIGL